MLPLQEEIYKRCPANKAQVGFSDLWSKRESILVHGSWRGGVPVWRGKGWANLSLVRSKRSLVSCVSLGYKYVWGAIAMISHDELERSAESDITWLSTIHILYIRSEIFDLNLEVLPNFQWLKWGFEVWKCWGSCQSFIDETLPSRFAAVKKTLSSRRILQFGPVFCALKKLGTGGGEPAAKGGTAPSCCSSEKAASGLPPWKSVFFFPAGNLFFFRFGGRKWKCPWVSWRWQMRYEGGFQKHKSTASWLLDIGCIPCHTNFSHALQGMISQRTNLEMKCRQVNYIDVFSAKCRLQYFAATVLMEAMVEYGQARFLILLSRQSNVFSAAT